MCEEEEDYEVEAVRKWRYNLRERRHEFYIKWSGYPEDQNTWEPPEHLHCDHLIAEFRKNLDGKQLQNLDSEDPDSLNGLQRNAEILNMAGRFARHQPSDSESATRTIRMLSRSSDIIVWTTFDDNDDQEPIELSDLRKYRPDKAFEFIEARLVNKAFLGASGDS